MFFGTWFHPDSSRPIRKISCIGHVCHCIKGSTIRCINERLYMINHVTLVIVRCQTILTVWFHHYTDSTALYWPNTEENDFCSLDQTPPLSPLLREPNSVQLSCCGCHGSQPKQPCGYQRRPPAPLGQELHLPECRAFCCLRPAESSDGLLSSVPSADLLDGPLPEPETDCKVVLASSFTTHATDRLTVYSILFMSLSRL